MTNMTNQQNPASTSQNVTSSYNAAMANQQPQAASQAQPGATNAIQQNQATAQTAPPTQAKAVVGIFRDLSSAEQAVTQLRNNGFNTEEINLVSKDPAAKVYAGGDDSIVDGTMTGGAIGGVGGLLLSAGALTIPGLGPIIAAGPLAATIAGAIGGGITGGLIDWGIPSVKSEEYNKEVSSGNTLAVIKTPETKVAQAVQILTSYGAMNVETHQTN